METEQNTNDVLINPVLTRVVHIQGRQKFIIPAHQHFDYELIYSLNGKYECHHNGSTHLLQSGEGLLNSPGDWHTDIVHKNVCYIAVNFVIQDCIAEKIFFPHIGTSANQLFFKDKDVLIKPILDRLIYENNKLDNFSTVIQEAMLLEMFWQIIRLLPTEVDSDDIFKNAEKVKFQKRLELLFQQHIYESLSLQQMATCLHMTPRTLNNHCHQFLNVSPVRAFMKSKMEHAMKMILQTDMSIKEISEYLGFTNPYHFSTVFKRTYFTAPTLMRVKK